MSRTLEGWHGAANCVERHLNLKDCNLPYMDLSSSGAYPVVVAA